MDARALGSLSALDSSDDGRGELADARESLAYWEHRAAELPRHAIRKRREARVLAARWRDRVAHAEREVYGRGLLGLVLLLVAERRLPQRTRHTAHLALRRAAQVALALVVALVALTVAAGVTIVQAIADVLT